MNDFKYDLNALNKALEHCLPIRHSLKKELAKRLNIHEAEILDNSINLTYEDAPEFQSQFNIVCNAFYLEPQTMKEVDVLTGIMRENICRDVHYLRKQGKIFVVGKRVCKRTKRLAMTLSTDPKYKDVDSRFKQLELEF